mgnify:CR=1 FL=1
MTATIRDTNGNPDQYGEDLYWYFSEFDLATDQVKKICDKFLKRLMEDGDTAMRWYYGEVRKFIKERGDK